MNSGKNSKIESGSQEARKTEISQESRNAGIKFCGFVIPGFLAS
jgi:hypothetical protein